MVLISINIDIMSQPEQDDDWIVRTLREMGEDKPDDYDPDAAMADFRAAVRRMETDPEYAAYIERLAAEADEEMRGLLAAQAREAERDGFDSHGVSGYEL
jgi:hypothetical protein